MVKGISPLVATVLLIAITMTLAGILAFWGSSFVRTGLPTEQETQQMRKCQAAYGSLKIDFQLYNDTAKTLYLAIYNTGPVSLNLTNITFYYSTTTNTKVINKVSNPGTLVDVNLDNIDPGYLKFTILTECPGVTLEGK